MKKKHTVDNELMRRTNDAKLKIKKNTDYILLCGNRDEKFDSKINITFKNIPDFLIMLEIAKKKLLKVYEENRIIWNNIKKNEKN